MNNLIRNDYSLPIRKCCASCSHYILGAVGGIVTKECKLHEGERLSVDHHGTCANYKMSDFYKTLNIHYLDTGVTKPKEFFDYVRGFVPDAHAKVNVFHPIDSWIKNTKEGRMWHNKIKNSKS